MRDGDAAMIARDPFLTAGKLLLLSMTPDRAVARLNRIRNLNEIISASFFPGAPHSIS